MPKLKSGLTLCLLPTALLLLQGCETQSSSAVSPTLAQYSKPFQMAAANELTGMLPPCARDVANEHCSAVHRLVIDYGDTREQIRALKQ